MKSTPRLRALWLSLSLQRVTSFGKIVELLGGEALLEEMGHNVSDVLALGMHTMIHTGQTVHTYRIKVNQSV